MALAPVNVIDALWPALRSLILAIALLIFASVVLLLLELVWGLRDELGTQGARLGLLLVLMLASVPVRIAQLTSFLAAKVRKGGFAAKRNGTL